MPITKEWLRQAATSQSFSKGEDYYDAVEDLVKQGDTYSAIVLGAEAYEVTITDKPNNSPVSLCDCPYSFEGICKHIVAVGLNIIDGNYEEEEETGLEQTMIVNESLPTTTFYDDFFTTAFCQ